MSQDLPPNPPESTPLVLTERLRYEMKSHQTTHKQLQTVCSVLFFMHNKLQQLYKQTAILTIVSFFLEFLASGLRVGHLVDHGLNSAGPGASV